MELYPFSKLVNLDREWSDHAPVMVYLNKRQVGEVHSFSKPFRFEQIWIGEEGCEDTIRRAWESGNDDVSDSLRRCAGELKAWKGINIGKIMKAIHQKRRRIKRLNEGGRTLAQIREREELVAEVAQLLKQEEIFLETKVVCVMVEGRR
ncbi:hypothetical protein RND81_09G000600 [Saponaria officinalis]|uniref:Uncharacterized protein n=1 Tax=Saponaria officinalis TaxID=3572 RepID=A0AAW1IG75_SAPOF